MNNQYGSHNDRQLLVDTQVAQNISPFGFEPFPANYSKVSLEWNDVLFGVTSNIECIPHPLTWGEDRVKHTSTMQHELVFNSVAPYLANMTDEERAMVEPQLQYLIAFGHVHKVACYDHTVEISVTINGAQRVLLITVMNMIDSVDDHNHYVSRPTLN